MAFACSADGSFGGVAGCLSEGDYAQRSAYTAGLGVGPGVEISPFGEYALRPGVCALEALARRDFVFGICARPVTGRRSSDLVAKCTESGIDPETEK